MAVLDLGKVVPEKGVDYFTESDINEIVTEATQSVKDNLKVSDLENDAGYIDKNVNDLVNYELKTNTGSTIELTIDSETYEMTLNLKNSEGTIISTGNIDLPLETMVVGASYDNENKKIVLTLKNGTTLDVPVGDLVNGLQAEITNTNKLDSSLVDDSLSDNKFVTSEDKANWNGKQDELTAGNNITIEDGVISASGGDEVILITDSNKNTQEILDKLTEAYNKFLNNEPYNIQYYSNVYTTSAIMYATIPLYFERMPNWGSVALASPYITTLFTSNSQRVGVLIVKWLKIGNGKVTGYNSEDKYNYNLPNVNGGLILTSNNNQSYTPTSNYHPAHKLYVDTAISNIDLSSKQDIIQYTELPTASAETVGKVIQYIGETDENYTNGYFYIGTTDGEEEPSYSWEFISFKSRKYAIEKNKNDATTLKILNEWYQDWDHNSFNIPELIIYSKLNNIITKAYNIIELSNYTPGNNYTGSLRIYCRKVLGPESVSVGQLDGIWLNLTITEGIIISCYYSNSNGSFLLATNKNSTITSIFTFNALPQSSVVPTTDNQLVNKKYVDDSISSAIGDINTVLATLTTVSEEE